MTFLHIGLVLVDPQDLFLCSLCQVGCQREDAIGSGFGAKSLLVPTDLQVVDTCPDLVHRVTLPRAPAAQALGLGVRLGSDEYHEELLAVVLGEDLLDLLLDGRALA